MKSVRILIADDHELVRAGLVELIGRRPGWIVAAEAENGRQAIDLARELQPDVAVLDISMPDVNGIEATREIARLSPETRIVVLTMHCNKQLILKVIEAGARAYVVKTDAGSALVGAIETVLEGGRFFSPTLSQESLNGLVIEDGNSKTRSALTRREEEIVRMLASGLSNKEAAADLDISLRTIEKHRANIMHKLRLHSIGDLVHYAMEHNLVT
ncbi:MAG: response regulator transcription factor [Acidobacteriota bacterium]|nr:response regulator transcription factor [Acidobacteriota bacterium]